MIQVLRKEAQSIPCVVCDECHQPITNADMGMVAYTKAAEGERQESAFLHKGSCDSAYKGGRQRPGGWVELRHFLADLCQNTGLDNPDKFGKALEDSKILRTMIG